MNDKYKYVIQFSLVFFLSHNLIAQDQQPISDIKSIGRYIENQGIELRIFPDRKSTLEIGLINGFLIERSDVGSNNFIVTGANGKFAGAKTVVVEYDNALSADWNKAKEGKHRRVTITSQDLH